MKVVRNLISMLALLVAISTFSQSYTLSGVIEEEGSGNPLSNATIRVVNSKIGTVTNANGEFSMELPKGQYDLVVTSVGFTTIEQTVDLNSNLELSFRTRESLLALPEFVVETNTLSAGRQGVKEIPGSVQYLDPKKLQEQRYSNVNDILKQVPGVNIQEEDGFGLRPNIGLRGSGLERSSKITLMEDGILAAPAPYAAPSAYYFPTVGRMNGVEVLKGASQVRFGPFTSGGAINFLSTPIPNSQSALIGVNIGSFGYSNVHAYVGDRKERYGYLIETFRYGSSGFKSVPNGESGFDKEDINAKFSLNTSPEAKNYQSLTFTIGTTKENSDVTYLGLTQEDFDKDPYQRYAASQVDNIDTRQNRFSIQHYLELPGLFNVVTTAYRNTFKRNWYKLGKVDGQSLSTVLDDPITYVDQYNILTGASNTATGDLIVRANNRSYVSKGVQTTFDVEFETGSVSHDIHISTRIHHDEEDRFQFEDGYAMENGVMELVDKGAPGSNANRIESADALASYFFYKISIGKLSFTPGIRNENVRVSREDYGKLDPGRQGSDLVTRSNHFSAWLPGVGVNYFLDPKTSLFGGVHKGFAPGGSVEGAEPEESVNYELGVRRSSKNLYLSAIFFMNDYQNLLGADNASAGGTGSGEMFNAGEANTKGLELEMNYNLLASSKNVSIPVTIAYTYTDSHFNSSFSSGFEGWGDVIDGDQIPYVPKNQLFMNVAFQTKNYSLAINGKYQSRVRTSPGSGEIEAADRIDSFFTSDVSLNYFLDSRTTFFGSVMNVTNTQYAVARRPAGLRPGMPRSIRLGVNVSF